MATRNSTRKTRPAGVPWMLPPAARVTTNDQTKLKTPRMMASMMYATTRIQKPAGRWATAVSQAGRSVDDDGSEAPGCAAGGAAGVGLGCQLAGCGGCQPPGDGPPTGWSWEGCCELIRQ